MTMLEGIAVVSVAGGAAFAPRDTPGTGAPRIATATSKVTSEARNNTNRLTRAPAQSDDSFRPGVRKKKDDACGLPWRRGVRSAGILANPLAEVSELSRHSIKCLEYSGFHAFDPRDSLHPFGNRTCKAGAYFSL